MDPIGLGESKLFFKVFFKLVGQRPETIQKLAATSECKFCYLIIATKQHSSFPKKKWVMAIEIPS